MEPQLEFVEKQVASVDDVVGEYNRLGVFMDGFAWYHDSKILELINNSVPATCRAGLDIGSGTGIVLHYLALKNRDACWLGIDISPEMVARAKNRCLGFRNVSLNEIDLRYLNRDGQPKGFDFILLKNVLHLIGDLPRQLSAIQSLLSPSGRLLIVETVSPNLDSKRFIGRLMEVMKKVGIKKHIFTSSEVVKSAKEAGLDVQKVQYHDQFIDLSSWINAKTASAIDRDSVLLLIEREMLSGHLRASMKYEAPTGSDHGKMLRRQILIQCAHSSARASSNFET